MADRETRLSEINHTWMPSGIRACRKVNLSLAAGEIHALVGENGAGKTTLGHILAGVRRPDSGTLRRPGSPDGVPIDLAAGRSGPVWGIGLVRQRSIWPSALEIWESAILGRSEGPRNRRRATESFLKTAEEWGLGDIDPRQSVSRMDAASLQRAELIAALMYKPDLLVLDEPASAWEEGRSSEFRGLMGRLKQASCAVLLITHRLEDVFLFADRVTVMRHGKVVGTWDTGSISREQLTARMFGESQSSERRLLEPGMPAKESAVSKVRKSNGDAESSGILALENVGIASGERKELERISFTIRPGVILGITGLREEGLRALEDVVSGNRRPAEGQIRVYGEIPGKGPEGMRRSGLRYVPSDSTGRGASLSSSLAENMALLDSRNLSRRGFLHPRIMHRWAYIRSREGRITGRPEQTLAELSGGNIQKVILQRELYGEAGLLVLADPAWGLDERSRLAVNMRIREAAEKGAAVLLLASDLDESLDLSDEMAILAGGRLSAIRPVNEWDRSDAAKCIADRHIGAAL